jgi:hypothetical protein
MKRLLNTLLGLAAGIVTAPLVAVAWPFVAAWFMFNESEGYEV